MAAAGYGLLEREVVPAFYPRDAQGIPGEWVRRIRASIRTMAASFTARRMLREHVERVQVSTSARWPGTGLESSAILDPR